MLCGSQKTRLLAPPLHGCVTLGPSRTYWSLFLSLSSGDTNFCSTNEQRGRCGLSAKLWQQKSV